MEQKRIWLNRYRILEQIGKGATGEVYLAEDTRLHRKVAVKVMHVLGAEFEKEVQVLQSLSLRILPTIYDAFVTEEGQGILVMEYVKGLDGASYIKTHGPSRPDQVYRWGITLAEGLKKLHQSAGHILYRDLKPANVIIDEYGEIRLIDVGAALVGDWNTEMHRGEVGCLLSTRVGSAGYAAPEQWEGKYSDESADVYGLGMVLTDFLTGELRFVAGTKRHGTRQETIPEPMKRVLQKAAAESKAERYANMEAFLQAWKASKRLRRMQNLKEKTILAVRIFLLVCMNCLVWLPYLNLFRMYHSNRLSLAMWKVYMALAGGLYLLLLLPKKFAEKRRGYWVCQRSVWRYDD